MHKNLYLKKNVPKKDNRKKYFLAGAIIITTTIATIYYHEDISKWYSNIISKYEQKQSIPISEATRNVSIDSLTTEFYTTKNKE